MEIEAMIEPEIDDVAKRIVDALLINPPRRISTRTDTDRCEIWRNAFPVYQNQGGKDHDRALYVASIDWVSRRLAEMITDRTGIPR